jgi:hypothetical protein
MPAKYAQKAQLVQSLAPTVTQVHFLMQTFVLGHAAQRLPADEPLSAASLGHPAGELACSECLVLFL